MSIGSDSMDTFELERWGGSLEKNRTCCCFFFVEHAREEETRKKTESVGKKYVRQKINTRAYEGLPGTRYNTAAVL